MADYRIIKQTNGLGAVRWVVQKFYGYSSSWEDRTYMKRSLASARRAMEKIERRERAKTWVEEEVD